MKIPDCFLVEYFHNGEKKKFITLEKSRAFEYAGAWHGRVYQCFADRSMEAPKPDDIVREAESLPPENG